MMPQRGRWEEIEKRRRNENEKREREREERLMKPNWFLVGVSVVILHVWSQLRGGQSRHWAGQAVMER